MGQIFYLIYYNKKTKEVFMIKGTEKQIVNKINELKKSKNYYLHNEYFLATKQEQAKRNKILLEYLLKEVK